MMLHVRQGDKPAVAPFPPEVQERLERLKRPPAELAAHAYGSRKIELKRR
jgi:hypothetical protein